MTTADVESTSTSTAVAGAPPEAPSRATPDPPVGDATPPLQPSRRRPGLRSVAMRPRRLLVRMHRWLSIILLAWLAIITITGGWLVVHDAVESWFHGDRYASTAGDIGADAASAAVAAELAPEGEVSGMTLPRNGRGVYLVYAEVPTGEPPPTPDAEAPHRHFVYYVDPGTGQVNDVVNSEAGATWWLYRGHMYLWQDWGLFGVFDADEGWCRAGPDGVEPGGFRGVVCDVIPDGMDLIGWFGVGWIVVLLSGFYLWYWPGVRRWATAFAVRRSRGSFAFNMSLHKAIGLVVWIPLLVVAFTGIAFAFPNLKGWYENVTPAARGTELWVPPEGAELSGDPAGRQPIGLDGVVEVLGTTYPDRSIDYVAPPFEENGHYMAWVTRGFSPWTREGGAGNTYVGIDQWSGEVLYDGTPEEGDTFSQLWSDWSFPLHTGDFAGTPSRVLWVVLAATPLALGITGVAMNLIRRRKRAQRTGRIPTEGPTEGPTVEVAG